MSKIRRYNKVQSHILVWCGDEPLEVMYNAVPMLIPPINEFARVEPGTPYRLPGATTKAGVPLPGTILVQDQSEMTPEGGFVTTFKVNDFCAFLERDCPELFARGFNIVTDPEDVRDVQLEGRPLYEASLDAKASAILEAELVRQKKLEEAGRPITVAPNEQQVIWAFQHKQKRGSQKPALSKDTILGAITGTYMPQEAPAIPSVEAKTAQGIIDECEALGINLTKSDLMALIRQDAEMLPFVMEKIALKKKEREESAAPA